MSPIPRSTSRRVANRLAPRLLLLIVLAVLLGLSFAWPQRPVAKAAITMATSQASNVYFAIPTDQISLFADHFEVVITGPASGTTRGVACVIAPGDYPIQPAVVLDPQAGSSPVTIILASQTEALEPGTHLVNIVGVGSCSIAGIDYSRFRAEVPGCPSFHPL